MADPPLTEPIRILHFADVHFGVETYGRFDPSTGLSTRLIDFRNALSAGIEAALQRGIEIALFAGDAYKSRDPSQTHQREFADCVRLLTSAGVPVVLLAGNHDIPNTKGKANAIEIYGALGGALITVLDKRAVIQVRTKAERTLQIAAIPYLTKSLLLGRDENAELGVADTTEAVSEKYDEAVAELARQCAERPDLPTVLMGHFTVTTSEVGATQAGYLLAEPQVSVEALRKSAFDYVALGHVHKFQDLNRKGAPPIVYCGSIERIDFGERIEEKGVVVADVSRGKATYEFVPVSTRPFLEIVADTAKVPARADVGGDPTIEPSHVVDPTDDILAAIAAHDISRAVVKLTYRVTPEAAPLVREREIRQALAGAFLVVAQQREVVGANQAAHVRSKLLKESLAPLDALSTYLDSKDHLAARKTELMAKAQEIWDQIVAREIA